MRTIHTIRAHRSHTGWDNSIEPVLVVAPGSTVAFEIQDASAGQLAATSTADDIASLDFDRVNPVTGPIYIEGAEPGDALQVTIHDFEPLVRHGWTAVIPGFGLLAEDFPDPALHVWAYEASLAPAAYGSLANVPLRPFAGTIGVALAESGCHSVVPPRRVGGNIDVRDLCAGSVLYLPVEVPGALFSVGDTHAAQGDGEVCGTAIETSMIATLSFDVISGAAPSAPAYETPGPVTRHLDERGYLVTTGVGPDLMAAAKDAVRAMIDLLGRRIGAKPEDAYMLCSVCADLRIAEIVDAPNWVVGCYFPKLVLSD